MFKSCPIEYPYPGVTAFRIGLLPKQMIMSANTDVLISSFRHRCCMSEFMSRNRYLIAFNTSRKKQYDFYYNFRTLRKHVRTILTGNMNC